MAYVFLNGEYVIEQEAQIPAQDRGFRFGDGVFETIRLQAGELCHWQRHMRRLMQGAQVIGLKLPDFDLLEITNALMQRNAQEDGVLRLAVSRGVGSAGYRPLAEAVSTLVIELLPMPKISSVPVDVWLSSWCKPDPAALPVNFKIAQGMNSVLALIQADENGCDEALLLSSQGHLCEASSANLFWQSQGEIYTSSAKTGALLGIARERLLEAWPEVQQVQAPLDVLQQAESVMLCNSVRGACAVSSLAPMGWKWQNDSLAHKAQEVLNRG